MLHSFPRHMLLAICLFSLQAAAYLIITEPTRNSKWKNNALNLISWQKGPLDGIDSFDIELARSTVDGNLLVAKAASASQSSLNIVLQDVPAGDDYYALFINSTHGVIHAVSSRFAILDSSSASAAQAPIQGAPTVTVSGSPNPTQAFATTFPARVNTMNGSTPVSNGRWTMQLAFVAVAVAATITGVLSTVL